MKELTKKTFNEPLHYRGELWNSNDGYGRIKRVYFLFFSFLEIGSWIEIVVLNRNFASEKLPFDIEPLWFYTAIKG
jgi:hypothetical protein